MSDAPTAKTILGGRYLVDRHLARGGMADIFLAHDQVLDRPIVIKMLLPQYAADPSFVERFRREATTAARLNHANVVSVYDFLPHEDTFFMAMEYVPGQSLAEVLVAERKLPIDHAIGIVSAAAAGLGFAHDHDMVHRDVKPGNIMITETGEVKVADFGIARVLDGSDGLTQTGNVMGTAAYFSPEQARGEAIDRRSDLYSLGVVLFELVTGERPFSGTSPLSIAYKHVGEAPPLASSIDPTIPPAIDAVIAQLLAKDPDHRYPDAEALRVELARAASRQEVLATGTMGATRAEVAVMPATTFGPAAHASGPHLARPHSVEQPKVGSGVFIAGLVLIAAVLAGVFIVAGLLGNNDAGSDGTSTVPGVIALSQAEADALLRQAGFQVVAVEEQPNGDVTVGNVFRQDPEPDAQAAVNSVVTIFVSARADAGSGDGSGDGTSGGIDPASPTTDTTLAPDGSSPTSDQSPTSSTSTSTSSTSDPSTSSSTTSSTSSSTSTSTSTTTEPTTTTTEPTTTSTTTSTSTTTTTTTTTTEPTTTTTLAP